MGKTLVNWRSKKQTGVTLSSTEAEYVALSHAATEAKFLLMLLEETTGTFHGPAIIHEDNQGAIFIANNDSLGQQTKHINIRYRYTNQLIQEGLIVLKYIKTDKNYADLETKNVTEAIHTKLAPRIYDGTM
jgi:hypothetical protein